MKKSVWRAVIEMGFIIFLFYSNLLMGEFERSAGWCRNHMEILSIPPWSNSPPSPQPIHTSGIT
jgi:hypothetical protein